MVARLFFSAFAFLFLLGRKFFYCISYTFGWLSDAAMHVEDCCQSVRLRCLKHLSSPVRPNSRRLL